MSFYFYDDKGRFNEHGNNMLCLVDDYIKDKYDVLNLYKESDLNVFLSNILSLNYLVSDSEVITNLIHSYCQKYDVDFGIDGMALVEMQIRDMLNGSISYFVSMNRIKYSIKLRKQNKVEKCDGE